MIELRTLGTAQLTGVPVAKAERLLAQPKRLALLSYLCVEALDGTVTRDQVIGVFWPDFNQTNARGSLRNALHHIRSVVGSRTLRSIGDRVAVDRGSIWCDAEALLNGAGSASSLQDLVRGEFLGGLYVANAPDFELWVDRIRSSVRARATALSWSLAEEARVSGEWITAAAHARRAVETAIDVEAASQRLIRLLDEAGDRAAALAEYERLAAVLDQEFGVHPSPETRETIKEIRSRGRPSSGGGAPSAEAEASDRTPSVAVLPFEALGPPEDAYVARGLTEDLLTALASLRGVRVISRASVQAFSGSPRDPAAGLRERLGVDCVLSGSVRLAGERIRITARLVDASSNDLLWGESYDRLRLDLFEIQSDVTLRIARALEAELSPREHARIRRTPTHSVEAYDRYLRGRHLWARRTAQANEAAIPHFEAAVAIDPDFTLGWVGLADAYLVRWSVGASDIEEPARQVRATVNRALELDPESGEARATLGSLMLFLEWDAIGALREYRRAVELSPGYPTARHWYGNLLVTDGRIDEGLGELCTALELDPLSPLVNESVGLGYYHADRPEKALVQFEGTLELDPGYWRARFGAALCLVRLERVREGVDQMASVWRTGGFGGPPAEPGMAQSTGGAIEGTLEPIIDHVRSLPANQRMAKVVEATLWMLAGQHERALDALEAARQNRTLGFMIPYLPSFDAISAHPRMVAILEAYGYVPARWR